MAKITPRIIEPPYFSNWADQIFPKIANKLLPFCLIIPGLTPNHLTLLSFALYTLGSILLFIPGSYNLYISAMILPIAYVLDCLDGQLARTKKISSSLGDYLDKTLDVLKASILILSLSLSMYLKTNNPFYFLLGFIASFGFNFRYYIKLETMFSMVSKDKNYLEKCRNLRYELYDKLEKYYEQLSKTFLGKLKIYWLKNRIIFFIDEAEFVVITSISAIFQRLDVALWIFAIGHFIIAFFRLFERGYQISKDSKNLFLPMRK